MLKDGEILTVGVAVPEDGRAGRRRSRTHSGRDGVHVHVVGEEGSDGGLSVEVGHPTGVDRRHGHLGVREVAVRRDGTDAGRGAAVQTAPAGLRQPQQLLDGEGRPLRHVRTVLGVLTVVVVVVERLLLLDTGRGHADGMLVRVHFTIHSPEYQSLFLQELERSAINFVPTVY